MTCNQLVQIRQRWQSAGQTHGNCRICCNLRYRRRKPWELLGYIRRKRFERQFGDHDLAAPHHISQQVGVARILPPLQVDGLAHDRIINRFRENMDDKFRGYKRRRMKPSCDTGPPPQYLANRFLA